MALLPVARALVRHLTCFPLPAVWDAMRRRVKVPVLLIWGDKDGAIGIDLVKGIEMVGRLGADESRLG